MSQVITKNIRWVTFNTDSKRYDLGSATQNYTETNLRKGINGNSTRSPSSPILRDVFVDSNHLAL